MKNVFITGANQGIGFETAFQLGKKGFHIYLGARDPKKGNQAVDKLHNENISSEHILIDVGSESSIRHAIKELHSKTDSLDVLINNAAMLIDSSDDILDSNPENLKRTIEVNSLGPFYIIYHSISLLKKGSRVINVSSGAGEMSKGMSDYAPFYSISKTTLNAITCQFAHSLKKKGISINAVCPGWVRTSMGGKSAPRSVEEGAETIVWLATDSPSSKTGLFWRDKKEVPW